MYEKDKKLFDRLDKLPYYYHIDIDDLTTRPVPCWVKMKYCPGISVEDEFENKVYDIYTQGNIFLSGNGYATIEILENHEYGIEYNVRAYNKDNLPVIIRRSPITIQGYVARDKNESLWFHYSKPHLENDIEKTWWGSNDKSFEIFDFDFPEYRDVTFEGGPVEVKLTLERL